MPIKAFILHRALGCGLALAAINFGCDAQVAPTIPPSRPFLVVANQRRGVATLIELSSGRVSHVALGADPHEVAVSPDARIAVLTVPSDGLRGDGRILVFDLETATIVRTIDPGSHRGPHGVAFVSDSVVLVGALRGTSVAYVDVRNGRVLRAVAGLPANPYIVALTATGRAYVSSPHSSKVTELDIAAGRATRTIAIPDDPAGIAVSRDGRELYAAVWREGVGGGITTVDLATGAIAPKLSATQPRRMTVTEDGKLLLVSDRNQLHIVDRGTRQVRSVVLGRNAAGNGVACSPDSARCWVALSRVGEVVEVDVGAAQVVRRFAAQPGVDGVAYVGR